MLVVVGVSLRTNALAAHSALVTDLRKYRWCTQVSTSGGGRGMVPRRLSVQATWWTFFCCHAETLIKRFAEKLPANERRPSCSASTARERCDDSVAKAQNRVDKVKYFRQGAR